MVNKNSIIGLIILTLISCQGHQKNPTNTLENPILEHSNKLIENSVEHIEGLPPILNSIINKNPKLDLTEKFELKKGADYNLDNKFIKLEKSHIDYFYSTDELQYYHSFFNFDSYFYGYNHAPNGLTKMFIINTNWQTAIYLDCFIINSAGEVLGYFNPSFLEGQPNYGYIGYGKFQNDTTYTLTMVSYDAIDDNDEIEVRSTKIQTISISKLGDIFKTIEKQKNDTILRSNN